MINSHDNTSKHSAIDIIYRKKPNSLSIFIQKCYIKNSNFTKGKYHLFLYVFMINSHENTSKPSAIDIIYRKKPNY